MNIDLSDGLGTDAAALVAAMAPAIDDRMLLDIAGADYGEEVDAHFAQLKRLRDHQTVEEPKHWFPEEVLELISSSEPEDPTWRPGGQGLHGHYMRAFSCACRLYTATLDDGSEELYANNTMVVQLLHSLRHIDERTYYRNAIRQLAYALDHWHSWQDDDGNKPFFLLGLLYLGLNDHASPEWVATLGRWVIAEEQRLRSDPDEVFPDDDQRWLLGTTFFNTRHRRWVELGNELKELGEELMRHGSQVADQAGALVHLIGHRLSCEIRIAR